MARQRHEIPTHLNVEDKAFYGLSARQFMHLTAGLAGAYTVWNQWPDLPPALRLALAAACFLVAAALALIQPHGRGFEEWLFVALHYAATPKTSVWRPIDGEIDSRASADAGWAALEPRLAWDSAAGARGVRPS